MARTFTLEPLSGSVNGKAITVMTDAFDTVIHEAQPGLTGWDELWLWVSNPMGVSHTLTIGFGSLGGGAGVAAGINDRIVNGQTFAARSGLVRICPGLILQNSLKIYAACGSIVIDKSSPLNPIVSSTVIIAGKVHRVSAT